MDNIPDYFPEDVKASLRTLQQEMIDDGKKAEEKLARMGDSVLKSMPPYIDEFIRASTKEEIFNIFDKMLRDSDYLKQVNTAELKENLKGIKKMNDTVLKTKAWKSKQIFNMYKLVKLYANVNTSVELKERFELAADPGGSKAYRFMKITPSLFVKYSKIFKDNHPSLWTRDCAMAFGKLLRKIKREDDGVAGKSKKKHTKRKCKSKKCKKKSKYHRNPKWNF